MEVQKPPILSYEINQQPQSTGFFIGLLPCFPPVHYTPGETSITLSWSFFLFSCEKQFGCCGAVRFEDWRYSVWLRSRRKDLIRPTEGRRVPDSCCISMTPKCGLSDGPSNIPYTVRIYLSDRHSNFPNQSIWQKIFLTESIWHVEARNVILILFCRDASTRWPTT